MHFAVYLNSFPRICQKALQSPYPQHQMETDSQYVSRTLLVQFQFSPVRRARRGLAFSFPFLSVAQDSAEIMQNAIMQMVGYRPCCKSLKGQDSAFCNVPEFLSSHLPKGSPESIPTTSNGNGQSIRLAHIACSISI